MPIAAAPNETGKRHHSFPQDAGRRRCGDPAQPGGQTLARAETTCLLRSRGLRGRCRLCGPAGSGLGLCLLPRRVWGRRRRRPSRLPGHGWWKCEPFPPPCRRLPCLSASCCPQLRAGRSLPGAVEKFGALVGFLFLLASASLVTGVNTASPRPAAGRYRRVLLPRVSKVRGF